MLQTSWHAQDISEVLVAIESSTSGLSTAEAERRLATYGANELERCKRPSKTLLFLRQFHNTLIYVLLISATVTFFLGHLIDTGVIVGVVILNTIFGFIQEGKAEKAIAAISAMLAPSADVIRDGRHNTIFAKNLVRGDIVLIKSGDKIPADLRLLDIKNLETQEAILTGEAKTVRKNVATAPAAAALGDRFNIAYSGTVVAYGKGTGVVVATGSETEIGKIGTFLKSIKTITTPLLQQINIFGRWLTLAIIILATFTFLFGVFVWHHPINEIFMAAVGVAVVSIPAELPTMFAIVLAIGITHMAKRSAIIRRLPAVETMGAITTICTDKTGTLTSSEQTIKIVVTASNNYNIKKENSAALALTEALAALHEHNDLGQAINAAVLCNDAEFTRDHEHNDKWCLHGNSVDKALLELGSKAKIDLHLLQQKHPRSDLIPYESEHKLMATLNHEHHKHHGSMQNDSAQYDQSYIYVKGAPERILEICSTELSNNHSAPLNYNYWNEYVQNLAQRGYLVIAIALKKTAAGKQSLSPEEIDKDFTLIALFGLMDTVRAGVTEAVAECHNAGIKVKMITGDHAGTASTIASQVGISSEHGVLTGQDIDQMNDINLALAVNSVNVFARTSPHHKLRLIQALQDNGELTAMTGDGANDAEALLKADIGVAMGKNGAEVAKESASMILADDNFATIVHAIEEGRIVYDNLKKITLLVLPTSAAEALTVIMAVLFGVILPVTPVQTLWINMLTAVTFSVTLGFEPAEDDVMKRLPRKIKNSIFSPFLIWRTVFITTLLMSCAFGLFALQRSAFGVDTDVARTVVVNMIILGEIAYLLNCRKIYVSMWDIKKIFSGKYVLITIFATIILQLIFTYLPVMQRFFGTAALSLSQWGCIILLSITIFTLVELEKMFTRNFVLNGRWRKLIMDNC